MVLFHLGKVVGDDPLMDAALHWQGEADVGTRASLQLRRARALHSRGQLDDARSAAQAAADAFQATGDDHSRAVTLGQIADIFMARGELDQAMRIRTEEELPVYEKLGDVRSLLVGRTKLALLLVERGRPEDAAEVARLLNLAHKAAAAAGYVRDQGQIEEIMGKLGMPVPGAGAGAGAGAAPTDGDGLATIDPASHD